MRREDATLEMKVVFGRSRGEQTLGEIIKLNLKTAKVRTLESRGRVRQSDAGKVWKVPFTLIRPANDNEVARAGDEVRVGERSSTSDVAIEYHPFQSPVDQHILEAIHCIYGSLSPENLSCDGELSVTEVRRRRASLEKKLRSLQTALGRQVSETAVWRWVEAKRSHQDEMNRPVAEAPVSLEDVCNA